MSAPTQNDLSVNALPPGTPLQQGGFVVGEVLGRGGFGITYRAQNRAIGSNLQGSGDVSGIGAMDNQVVAIKEFFPEGCVRSGVDVQFTASPSDAASAAEEDGARQNFLNEARVLGALHHPGIVGVYAAFQENNTAYMVMEFLDGATLQEIVDRRGPVPENEALGYIEKIGAALSEVHRANFIHRDIKAENIIIGVDEPPVSSRWSLSGPLKSMGNQDTSSDARVTLLDFGLNKEIGAVGTYHTLRLTDALRFGSPGYSPPEQYGRQARFGPYTDIYALGALLYYLLSGQMPPEAPERMGGEEVTPLHQLRPQISLAVSDAVMWALQLKGEERPQTVPEFLNALRPQVAIPRAASKSNPDPVVKIVTASPPQTFPTPPSLATSHSVVSPSSVTQNQFPATGRTPSVSLISWVTALPGRGFTFVVQGLKRAVRNVWMEFLHVVPRLLFLAFLVAVGILMARHQRQHRLQQQQQWLHQRLRAKPKPVKSGRAAHKHQARSRRAKK